MSDYFHITHCSLMRCFLYDSNYQRLLLALDSWSPEDEVFLLTSNPQNFLAPTSGQTHLNT